MFVCLQWEDSPAQWRDPTLSPCILPTNPLTLRSSTAALTVRMRRSIKSLSRKWSQWGGRQKNWVMSMKKRRPSQSEARLSVHKRWFLSRTTRGATRSPQCLNLSYVNWSEVRFLSVSCLFFVCVDYWNSSHWFPALSVDFYLSSLSQLHSAEMQEQLLSCLSSDPYTNWEPWDKKVTSRPEC